VDLATGRVVALVEARGRADSIVRLVDTLAVRLVSIQGGEDMLRAGVLGASSVPALRAYLEGRAALRRGEWVAAIRDFDEAIAFDSTFASAALGLREASGYYSGERAPFAESLAWRNQNRLGPRERATFLAELGPHYPAYYPAADRLRAWRGVVSTDFFNADAWKRLGLVYYHQGARLGVPDAMTEARIALERAWEFDSTGGLPSRLHIVGIAAVTGDSALIRRVLSGVAIAHDDTATLAFHRWLRAFTKRDTAALAAARPGLDHVLTSDLVTVWNMTQRVGFDVGDAMRVEAIVDSRIRSYNDRAAAAALQYHGNLNRGRPVEAQRTAGMLALEWRPLSRLALQALDALYGDADTTAGAAAARALAREVSRPLASDAAELRSQMIHVCVSAQWSLAHGDARSVDAALAKLRTPEPGAGHGSITSFYETCVAAIEAWRAVVDHRSSSRMLMERLDSLMLTGPAWHWALPDYRVAARLWDASGDPVRALAAIRRRRMDVHLYLAPDLREEGRLALAAGDTAGAVAAWRQYLALRSDPEPAFRAEVAQVRRHADLLSASLTSSHGNKE
jgi:tetratricopeptide (TPR) repeat protein